MQGMRAASLGVPFMPVAGLDGSDIPNVSGFHRVRDPFSGQEVWVVPSVQPDWAILHVHQADPLGNARILGSPFWDRLMSRAAKRVIILAEEVIPTEKMARQPELTTVPHLFVEAVVHAPGGTWPTSCPPWRDFDEAGIRAYLSAIREPDGLARLLAEREAADHAGDSNGGPGGCTPWRGLDSPREYPSIKGGSAG